LQGAAPIQATVEKCAPPSIGLCLAAFFIFDLYRFMRWTATSRMFGMIPVYDKTSPEVGDRKVLEVHPFVQTWKEALPYLQKHCTAWRSSAKGEDRQ